ncbi:MAG: cytochrome P450 [Acidimicrobiales bacterium]
MRTPVDPVAVATSLFDRSDKAVRADPYPLYQALREHAPVHFSEQLGGWLLSRHEDVTGVLRDRRWSNDPRNATGVADDEMFALVADMMAGLLLLMDPPDHTRVRSLVSKAFTPKVIEQLRPHIEATVEGLLDEAVERGALELMSDVAYPLPVTVIAELLGVPVADRDLLKEHSRLLVWLIEWQMPLDKLPEVGGAAMAVGAYLMGVIEERRAHPRDDLISALVAAEEAGDRLSPEELLTTCILLLIAGHETTMNLIGNGMLALLRHPDQLARLREDPTLTRPAIEELLRYDGPIQLTARTALEDIDIGGTRIAKGEQVVVLLGAANRDPAVFAAPDALDLTRVDTHHLAFGHGAHFCLGAALARVEAQVVIAALLRRFPDLTMADAPIEWRETITIRGLQALPLRLR